MFLKLEAHYLTIVVIFFITISYGHASDGIKSSFDKYVTSLNQNDYSFVVDSIPESILLFQAKKNNMELSEFKKIVLERYKELYTHKPASNYAIDFKLLHSFNIDNGIIAYTVPFTFIVVQNDGIKVKPNIELIGINDNNRWYFIRTDEKSLMELFKNKYKKFDNIKLTPLTYTDLEDGRGKTPPYND